MLRHIVLFRLAPSTSPAARRAARDAIAGFPEHFPEIRALDVGLDAGVLPDQPDVHHLVAVADFPDADSYLAVRHHPLHGQLVDRFITPHLERRAAIQYVREPPAPGYP